MDPNGQVRLLLGSPGQPPPTLPASRWVLWGMSAEQPLDPCAMAARARVSPVAPRAERSLVTAVGDDDIDGLLRLCDQGGAVQEAALVLASGRLGDTDLGAAVDLTTSVLRGAGDPGSAKVLRRHWPELYVLAPLAPSVPALVPVSRIGLGLLLADMLLGTGRPVKALAVLQSLPSHPTVSLALAATLLGNGEHDHVLAVTSAVTNTDDVAALTLVARSVAARATQDLSAALDAACAALSEGDRSPGVVAAALEERSHIYSLADRDDAARGDLEALAALAAAFGPVEIPPPTTLARAGSPAASVEHSRDRARARMRRRILGVGEPGTFGGRHHSTYRDEIAAMFALGQTDAVEELLLGLLDAVEDEVAEVGVALDPTFFLTLADLYNDCGRAEDLAALQDRFAAAEARSDVSASPDPPQSSEAPEAHGPVVITRPPERQARTSSPAVGPTPDASTPHPDESVPDDTLVSAGRGAEDAEEPDPTPRPLTPVERAVRGPRVRSL